MKRTLLLLLLLSALLTPVRAQDDYRLHTPGVEEYLNMIPNAVNRWIQTLPPGFAKVLPDPFLDAINFELQHTISYDAVYAQNFDMQMAAYQSLQTANVDNPLDDPTTTTWITAILKAWLNENSTDLATTEKLNFSNFRITVQPFDLNNDGENEFWLDLFFNEYHTYLVLQRDPTEPSGYRFVESPLYWLNLNYGYGAGLPNRLRVIAFEDLTGDDIPEWLIFISRNPSTQGDCGNLDILSWQDDALVNLMPGYRKFCLPDDFVIENIDDDPALEITQLKNTTDNWLCERATTYQMDWDGTAFQLLDAIITYSDTLGCFVREAELLMWEGQFAEAIPLYEAGFSIGWNKPIDDAHSVYVAELERYAKTRLALAYAMIGDLQKSKDLLAELAAVSSTSEAIDTMITTMFDVDTPLDMCVAAYNIWKYYQPVFSYGDIPITVEVGRENFIVNNVGDYAPDPEKAGCDAPKLINALLERQPFTTSKAPDTQLTELGLKVLDTFVADFDANGQDEWIVWLKAHVNPILFVAEGENYTLSRPDIRYPGEFTHFGTQQIPDQKAFFFVDYAVFDFEAANIDYRNHSIKSKTCDEIVFRDDGTGQGNLYLWRLQGNQLVQVLYAPVCAPKLYSHLFSGDGRSLFAAGVIQAGEYDYQNRYADLTYIWDYSVQNYIAPAPVTITPTPAYFYSRQQPTNAYLIDTMDQALTALNDGDPDMALMLVDAAIANHDPSAEKIVIDALSYYRALALEALNRPDEALAEYITLYETAPDSAWGMLARLHLEPIDE